MNSPNVKQEHDELCKIININEDACEFYNSAAKKAGRLKVKQTFQDLESLHKNIIVNLQHYLRKNGFEANAQETMVGQAQKFWAGLMTSISNDVDETLIAHLENAEDRCLHSMQDAIKGDNLLPQTKQALQSELVMLERSHDYMKKLKEQSKNAA